MEEYRERIADKILEEMLESIGAILIQGSKWCGKTTTAAHRAKTIVYFDDPEHIEQNMWMVNTSSRRLLEGETPVLIDEWQIAPRLWDTIRHEVDRRSKMGQFILTGSAVPVNTDQMHHTGTGRIARLTMRPMSLFESGDSTGEVSLRKLAENPAYINETCPRNSLTLDDIAYLICRGGWPQALGMDRKKALLQARYFYDGVVNMDISRVDDVRRSAETTKRLMRSYARHQGTQATIETIVEDMKSFDPNVANPKTISSYIEALRKIFVVEDSPTWNPNLRSKSAIRTSDTRYFVDPSIAAVALGLGPKDLIGDLRTMGLLFETLVIRDLRVFAESMDAQIYHFRDRTGLECDAVLHFRNGHYGLIEIKLGGDDAFHEGSKNLKKLASKIDTTKMYEPSFMMVITGVDLYSYMQEDGILRVPIGVLRD